MKTKLRSAVLAVLVALATLAAPIVVAPSASAHGWITNPPSRQDHCANNSAGFDCGQIKYEPHSVEAPKGSMQCSGGSRFSILDENRDWPRTTVGSSTTFRWQITARHSTSTWEYFVDGQLWKTIDDGGAQPGSVVEHTLTGLPSGNHTVLARWNVADTAMAFYACVDLNVGGGGGGTDPDPEPEPEPEPEPGDCTAAAWDSSAVYTSGDRVAHDGHEYEAKWWTTGDDPSSSGQWDVWRDLGAC